MSILGQRIGELQVIRLIGKGALARVFLASDGERILAVKVFPESGFSHTQRELDLGGGLDHPNLNPILELHELQQLPALTMPFVKGRRLSEWLAGNPDPIEFLKLVPDVVDALAHLAELGIVHRDVKPENLIVGEDGHVTLIDYDIATRVGTGEPLVRMAGTLAFLSPEQALGQPVTPASDLYSLGALLYWGACQEVPFSGEPAEVLASHLKETPRRVSEIRPELAALDGLVAGLLSKRPEERPGHARVNEEILGLLRRHGG